MLPYDQSCLTTELFFNTRCFFFSSQNSNTTFLLFSVQVQCTNVRRQNTLYYAKDGYQNHVPSKHSMKIETIFIFFLEKNNTKHEELSNPSLHFLSTYRFSRSCLCTRHQISSRHYYWNRIFLYRCWSIIVRLFYIFKKGIIQSSIIKI